MLVDARTLSPNQELQADVCIVGAGPAGIVLALELLGTGVHVCLLESGDREPTRPPRGSSIGYPYFSLDRTAARAFGGTSHLWEEHGEYLWHSLPLDRLDFEARPGIEYSAWPYPRSDLVPYYERAAAVSDAVSFVYSTDSRTDDDLASHIAVRPGRIVVGYVQRSTATFAHHIDRVQRDDGVQLVLNATVGEIVVDGSSNVQGVRAFSAPGQELSVRSKLTVLAAGGIENPRLLLLSNRDRPRGLGNEQDLVGRFFMEHLMVPSGIVEPAGPTLFRHPWLYAFRQQDGGTVRPVLRVHDELTLREEMLNVGFILNPRSRAAAAEGARSLWTLRQAARLQPRPRTLAGHARNTLRDVASILRSRVAPNDVFIIGVQAEQEPNPASRVMLDERRDRHGLRVPLLDWRLTDRDLHSIRRAQELLDEELRLAGLGRVQRMLGDEEPSAVIVGIHHHMGSTRMHVDPKLGVVDEHCRVHGLHNLFVAGSSVFPTGGWANPTFTILALTIKLADHLRAVLGAD